eukprot:CAMPEP_0116961962 /NCGR_PEP_ID=MMETSP0467-20121206/46925_1 /TAXON_ID=283647 /ORGANISM="Mesodinium pulex, Strain SPMC105" /LENGTH=58 /DNA_ID=CAMNT_0004650095 /DNA_START=603 /DNA_END=779 /DNA_ORIENTATION=+
MKKNTNTTFIQREPHSNRLNSSDQDTFLSENWGPSFAELLLFLNCERSIRSDWFFSAI